MADEIQLVVFMLKQGDGVLNTVYLLPRFRK